MCPVYDAMVATLGFKICEIHRLLKSYNGGLWKTFTFQGPWILFWLILKIIGMNQLLKRVMFPAYSFDINSANNVKTVYFH